MGNSEQQPVNVAFQVLNNRHIGFEDPCMLQAATVILAHPEELNLGEVGVASLGLGVEAKTQNNGIQTLFFEDAMVINTERGPLVLFEPISEAEFEQMRQKAAERKDLSF